MSDFFFIGSPSTLLMWKSLCHLSLHRPPLCWRGAGQLSNVGQKITKGGNTKIAGLLHPPQESGNDGVGCGIRVYLLNPDSHEGLTERERDVQEHDRELTALL